MLNRAIEPLHPEAVRLKRDLIIGLPKFAGITTEYALAKQLRHTGELVRSRRPLPARNALEAFLSTLTESTLHRGADRDDVGDVLDDFGDLINEHGYDELQKTQALNYTSLDI